MSTSAGRHRFSAAVVAAACALGVPGFAAATQKTPTYNGITCSITAANPTLTSTKQLTGNASISCTKASTVAATSVTVSYVITVVEMDGTTEQTLSTSFQKSLSASITFGKATAITTYTLACPSTEAGNEEYATKARVQITGSTWTLDDRSVPVNDQYAC